jgi:hypothetical protein
VLWKGVKTEHLFELCPVYDIKMNTTKRVRCDRNQPFSELPFLSPAASIFDAEVLMKCGYVSEALAELNRKMMSSKVDGKEVYYTNNDLIRILNS